MQKTTFNQHPISQSKQQLAPRSWPFGQHREMDLVAVAEAEVDGVQMGVLGNGTPYLTMRGLSRLCGTDPASIQRLANQWGEEQFRPRGKRISELLHAQGHPGDFLYVRVQGPGGEAHAFPDAVCMAILEYYAFDAKSPAAQIAQTNYRLLARQSLRQYIYDRCGYQPTTIDQWRQFKDRVSILSNSVPPGYFSIFSGIADLLVGLGEGGLHIDEGFVPDISVGRAWSTHWKAIGGDQKFGPRIKYPHNYPEYFPQAASNPQEPWAYPDAAYGEFKRWMRVTYIGDGGLRRYLASKVGVASNALPAPAVERALAAIQGAAAQPSIR